MNIEHLALWVQDLEAMRSFYEKYFGAQCGKKYVNPSKNFQSYFLTFENGCRLELMHNPALPSYASVKSQTIGLAHFAVSTGSKENVNLLTEKLRTDGFHIQGEPRTTGDGYYESVILDPEGNSIEITI